MAHDVGSASRSVLLLDALIPLRPSLASAQRRAGGPCLFTPSTNTNTNTDTNDYPMGHSETNARGEGGCSSTSDILYVVYNATRRLVLWSPLARRQQEKKRPTGPSSPGPGPGASDPGPQGPTAALLRFYSKMEC